MQTLYELFGGKNFNFLSPFSYFFERLRGGQCDPRVTLFRKGVDFAQRKGHYWNLRRYHDLMLGRIWRIKEAWQNCEGYGLEEKIRLLHIMRSQESLGNESDQNTEFDLEPKSESELQNSDSDDNLGRDYLNGSFRESLANRVFKRRNQNLDFKRTEKRAIKSQQLKCDEEKDVSWRSQE
jgi:hypothetical protein